MSNVSGKVGVRSPKPVYSTISQYPSIPSKLHRWRGLHFPPIIIIIMIVGITLFSKAQCTKVKDIPLSGRPAAAHRQIHGEPLLPSTVSYQQNLDSHQKRIVGVEDEDNGPIYECPPKLDHNLKGSEMPMERLNMLGIRIGENDQAKQKEKIEYLSGGGGSSTDKNLSVMEIEDCSSTSKLWTPSEKLFGGMEMGSQTNFRICARSFICPTEREVKTFHWHPEYDTLVQNKNNHSFPLSNMTLIRGGYLVWNKQENERHFYRRKDYCISREKSGPGVSFVVCIPSCTDSNPCVRKCCSPSHVFDADTKNCIPAQTEAWRPIFYKSANEQETNTEGRATNASIIVGYPNCPKKYMINESPTNNFKLLLNGTLVQIDGIKQTHINPGEFCIDGIFYDKKNEERKSNGLPIIYSRSEWDQVVIACIPNTYKWEIDKWRIPLYASLNCVSAIFLFATLITFLLLYKHQNIHGWLQFSYATSLFCTFTCFVVVQLWSKELLNISRSLCKIMGYLNHLTYLSAFFWLTCMNFDLWWRFSRPLQNSRMRPRGKKVKRFLGFAAFSIGIPLLISCIGITLDTVYDGMLLDPPFTIPGIGEDKCYFKSKRSQIPYLYGPAGVLLLIDLVFFTSTVLHLKKIHSHTELARTQSTLEDKKGLKVIAKLFVVMGVLWVFELASWIAHILLPDKEIILIYVFFTIDVLNCLQGVAIFFIFVCKPTVTNQLHSLFRREDPGKTWNKQAQPPSVATVQQTIRPNEYGEIK